MPNRRDFMKFGMGAGFLLGTGLSAPGLGRAQARGPAPSNGLAFPANSFSTLTKTIATDSGTRTVTYRFWKAVPYVAKPVDVAYQSLNVSVPVAIDGKAVDAMAAPILLSNSVGGYMPSSVAQAEGIGGGMMGMPPGGPRMGAPGRGAPPSPPPGGMSRGGMQAGGMPPGPPPGDAPGPMRDAPSGSNAMLDRGRMVSNAEQALAAGYVVVEPGARGRTLTDADGVYYGTAPAAIVDLKAAIRYLRANQGRIPGNTERIVTSGTSAGGALSALLGASGDDPHYLPYLAEIGAADASDAVFAVGSWCPIADLDHADMAYEWNWGGNSLASGQKVDQVLSQALRDDFSRYQAGLGLKEPGGFGPLTADSYGDYLLRRYLLPEATRYLSALSTKDRIAYLTAHPTIGWADGKASFTWDGYLAHVGARKKGLPAFDAFDLSSGENNLFGTGKVAARHFTPFSLHHTGADASARIDADLPEKLRLMNPMIFLAEDNPGRARHWWIRVGAKDSDTSLTVVGNLAAMLENLGDQVDTRLYWDAGHGANEDAAAFTAWIGAVTGYTG